MAKRIFLSLALLLTTIVSTWADDVNYLYYTAIINGNKVSLMGTVSTASNPTVLTSTLLENSNEDNLDDGWYVLDSNLTYGERIVISGDVHLILKDGCTLTAEQGIRINTDATLSIYAQSVKEETMGKLVATESHHDKAAIGGNKNYRAGTLVIHGGIIEAVCEEGSKYAAGIGGGYGDGSGMEAITIYGGKVKAVGAYLGAGIGGGKNNNYPGTITIYGGKIEAWGGGYGAGIGGGENRAGWKTYIYEGEIKSTGGYYGAGIGGGEEGKGGYLNIYGGLVRAYGGEYAAGIGGGEDADGGTTIINGGHIYAWGANGGPGIGGGSTKWPPHGRKSGTITINDGLIVAHGSCAEGDSADNSQSGAGIGTGYSGTVETITIAGGNIQAYGSNGSAGIGGGHCSEGGGIINITGGTIYAQGGQFNKSEYLGPENHAGPGIGAGCDSEGDFEIKISGTPFVEAVGGQGAAAIGSGYQCDDDFKISITGGHIRANVDYVGDNKPMLIGVGGWVGDKQATVTIADGLALWAGESNSENTIQKYSDRVSGCMGRGYKYGDINTHSEHGAYTYTLGESPEQHVARCGYCGKEEPAESHTNDGTGKCEKCGYDTHTYAVKVYQTTGSGMGYGEGVATANVIPGQEVALPDIDQSSLPAYMMFEGWLQDPATAPTIWEKQDGETLLEPGTAITPTANVNLYARYSYQYGTEWTWDANSQTASATLRIINLEDNNVVDTIDFGDDERMQISASVISASAEQPGSVQYIAQVNYTDAQGRSFSFIDSHTVTVYIDVSLGEDDNTTAIADNDGAVANTTLTGRTLYKDGDWNTLCLPFDVSDISASPLAGATMKELTDASFADGTLTLTFADATSIKAGQAYLVKWDSGTNLGPSDLVFKGVTLNNFLSDDEISTDDSGTAAVAFMGTYKKQTLAAGDRTVFYLGADNTLYYPQSAVSIGAQRAYFKLSGLTVDEFSAGINALTLDFGDEQATTGIGSLTHSPSPKGEGSDGWHTLDGRRLSGKPTQKGIYISNGRKVVIQ